VPAIGEERGDGISWSAWPQDMRHGYRFASLTRTLYPAANICYIAIVYLDPHAVRWVSLEGPHLFDQALHCAGGGSLEGKKKGQ
jgi:hypothetical protein